MDQPQLIVGMKIVVVSATHAFKTLLLSLMEKKKRKKKKRISLSFLAIVVIFFQLFSFIFFFPFFSISRTIIIPRLDAR